MARSFHSRLSKSVQKALAEARQDSAQKREQRLAAVFRLDDTEYDETDVASRRGTHKWPPVETVGESIENMLPIPERKTVDDVIFDIDRSIDRLYWLGEEIRYIQEQQDTMIFHVLNDANTLLGCPEPGRQALCEMPPRHDENEKPDSDELDGSSCFFDDETRDYRPYFQGKRLSEVLQGL